jgi:hypothetical protein
MTTGTAIAPDRERTELTDEQIARFAERIAAAVGRPGMLDVLCDRIDDLLKIKNTR